MMKISGIYAAIYVYFEAAPIVLKAYEGFR